MSINQNKVVYKKNIKFKNEQNIILLKIYEILNLNEQNKLFYSHTLDNDILMQNKIMDLREDIGNYFKVSSWVVFKKNTIVEKPYLSIIRSVLKNMKIEYSCSSCKIKNNDKQYINTTIYILNKL